MSSLTERLRGVIGSGGSGGSPPSPSASAFAEAPADRRSLGGGWSARQDPDVAHGFGAAGSSPSSDPAEVLGGEWCEGSGHGFVTVDRTYLPGYRHGQVTIADGLPPSDGPWPRLALLAGASCGQRLLFLDLETTGLAGGAGTHAFLVGCAWFDGDTFRTRQFFLSSPVAERAMLGAVAELAGATGAGPTGAGPTGAIVTYNGKTFDLPLIETRFLFHRLETPFARMPHLDMLHAARRLWRQEEPLASFDGQGHGERFRSRAAGGCRLSVLESAQCGHVRDGDVPGFEIPSRYFHFVRTGDARALAGVFEHNRLDLLSLALLTARAAQLLEEGPSSARTVREALGLGRLFERGGLTQDARACYARAAGLEGGSLSAPDPITRVEALRSFAVLSRRERRHEEAATAWGKVLETADCPPRIRHEAAEALAVHHEHRRRDPSSARAFALRLLDPQAAFEAPVASGFSRKKPHTEAIHHRLARLGRKLDTPTNLRLF